MPQQYTTFDYTTALYIETSAKAALTPASVIWVGHVNRFWQTLCLSDCKGTHFDMHSSLHDTATQQKAAFSKLLHLNRTPCSNVSVTYSSSTSWRHLHVQVLLSCLTCLSTRGSHWCRNRCMQPTNDSTCRARALPPCRIISSSFSCCMAATTTLRRDP
jgi:hypothetical protein